MIQCASWAISLNSASHRIANHSFQVCWSPSSLGWTKLNTDGAVRLDSTRASACGLLCDSNGDWRPWDIRFCHVPREANKAVDFMSGQSQVDNFNMQTFEAPPAGLHHLLL
ncbi:hypothetical protein PVK06_041164 [Gossypium arboreum]|uniref:RNase H type-1 domain-containing protein n=1 Tax=Gossypium arboreum TaxID=29729 RepID=A0ABR0N8C0_GOSAR|nr:hypothetical protein PVK06_041164 [Gossypium arboreum]